MRRDYSRGSQRCHTPQVTSFGVATVTGETSDALAIAGENGRRRVVPERVLFRDPSDARHERSLPGEGPVEVGDQILQCLDPD